MWRSKECQDLLFFLVLSLKKNLCNGWTPFLFTLLNAMSRWFLNAA